MKKEYKVHHIYKTNCFKSSRVVLQTNWDKSSTLLHLGDTGDVDTKYGKIKSMRLTVRNLIKIFLSNYREEKKAFIFHAQSSLPYLFTILPLYFFLKKKNNITLVYDIHDLHEPFGKEKWMDFFSYTSFRFHILRVLERLICKSNSIKKITVSRGLSKTIAKQYKTSEPTVIKSALNPKSLQLEGKKSNRRTDAILFFGTAQRAPLELMNKIARSGYKLHLYGRGFDKQELIRRGVDPNDKNLHIFGEYSPNDLGFLLGYKYLIIYAPNNESLNFRYSLPNKLFQGMCAGLQFIVSENFEELITVLDKVPGSVVTLNGTSSLKDAINNLANTKESDFDLNMLKYCTALHESAKKMYLEVTQSE